MNPTAARSRQIRAILRRHSLGFLVGVIGAGSLVPFHHGLLGHRRRDRSYATPEHLRLVLEELGPAFVKLGQILSTRGDLLPPDFITELAKLQDAAPPVDIDEIRQTIHAELGAEPEMLFAWFDPEPLASASIGQAHAATLRDGTSVVVKVRRPGVVAQVEEDLEILQSLAARATQSWDFARDYDLPGIAAEFAVSLRAELDYLQEGRNAERIRANFAADDGVVVPRVFWEMTTKSVITLERMTGIKVNDLIARHDSRAHLLRPCSGLRRSCRGFAAVHGALESAPVPRCPATDVTRRIPTSRLTTGKPVASGWAGGRAARRARSSATTTRAARNPATTSTTALNANHIPVVGVGGAETAAESPPDARIETAISTHSDRCARRSGDAGGRRSPSGRLTGGPPSA
ncbi:MAG: AarF/UbiB family protein [Pseudolysinimonas sp.]|uniref:ABC1 kinase family protein n=1 Tax=Pseudolysinimonas sp. TaxID=2680009 RepID=UPI003C78F9C6